MSDAEETGRYGPQPVYVEALIERLQALPQGQAAALTAAWFAGADALNAAMNAAEASAASAAAAATLDGVGAYEVTPSQHPKEEEPDE